MSSLCNHSKCSQFHNLCYYKILCKDSGWSKWVVVGVVVEVVVGVVVVVVVVVGSGGW